MMLAHVRRSGYRLVDKNMCESIFRYGASRACVPHGAGLVFRSAVKNNAIGGIADTLSQVAAADLSLIAVQALSMTNSRRRVPTAAQDHRKLRPAKWNASVCTAIFRSRACPGWVNYALCHLVRCRARFRRLVRRQPNLGSVEACRSAASEISRAWGPIRFGVSVSSLCAPIE